MAPSCARRRRQRQISAPAAITMTTAASARSQIAGRSNDQPTTTPVATVAVTPAFAWPFPAGTTALPVEASRDDDGALRTGSLRAIASAVASTEPTRRVQPRPNTGKVLRLLRNAIRSAQIADTVRAASVACAASITASVTALVPSGRSSTRRSTFPARPIPEFTP